MPVDMSSSNTNSSSEDLPGPQLRDFGGHTFEFISVLGEGAFGTAYHVRDDSVDFVVKRTKDPITSSNVLREFVLMQNLCSEYVTQLHGAWVGMESRMYLLMEYCNLGDLDAYMEKHFPLSETVIVHTLTQLLLGLHHIHMQLKIHRDIKLENILLTSRNPGDPPTVKIGDFGLCRQLSCKDSVALTEAGTPLFYAPELLCGQPYTGKVDVWSLGVVMYKVMTNRMPFAAHDLVNLQNRVLYTVPEHPSMAQSYSRKLGDIVMTMLTKSRRKRPLVEDILKRSIFSVALDKLPWLPPSVGSGAVMVVHEESAEVSVYASPDPSSEVVAILCSGDQVLIDRSKLPQTPHGCWVKLIHPFSGYAMLGGHSCSFFGPFSNTVRLLEKRGYGLAGRGHKAV